MSKIDYKKVKTALNGMGFIDDYDELSYETVQLIRSAPKPFADSLFKRYNKTRHAGKDAVRYIVHLECIDCGTDYVDKISKSQLIQQQSKFCNQDDRCSTCEEIHKQNELKRRREKRQARKNQTQAS